MAKQPVADWEKQMVLDLLKREALAVDPRVVARTRADGFNVSGIVTI